MPDRASVVEELLPPAELPWKGINPAHVRDGQVEQWQSQLPALDEQHNNRERQRRAMRRECIRLAKELTNENGRLARYLETHLPTHWGSTPSRLFELQVLDPRKRIALASAKEAKEQEKRESEDAKATRAVLWLQSRGLALGKDFTIGNALEEANRISFEEECARREAEGGLISFSGEDSCEDCGGWDMKSRRCECGNRRVCWSSDDYDFEHPYIYAEAW